MRVGDAEYGAVVNVIFVILDGGSDLIGEPYDRAVIGKIVIVRLQNGKYRAACGTILGVIGQPKLAVFDAKGAEGLFCCGKVL